MRQSPERCQGGTTRGRALVVFWRFTELNCILVRSSLEVRRQYRWIPNYNRDGGAAAEYDKVPRSTWEVHPTSSNGILPTPKHQSYVLGFENFLCTVQGDYYERVEIDV